MPVDFDLVRANAAADGIPLSQIAVIYKDLSYNELQSLRAAGLVAAETEETVIGRFAEDGNARYADKAIGVYSLSA